MIVKRKNRVIKIESENENSMDRLKVKSFLGDQSSKISPNSNGLEKISQNSKPSMRSSKCSRILFQDAKIEKRKKQESVPPKDFL
jgi:hypothetical protein